MRYKTSTIFAVLSIGAVVMGAGCAAQGEDALAEDSLSSKDKVELKATPVKIDEDIKNARGDKKGEQPALTCASVLCMAGTTCEQDKASGKISCVPVAVDPVQACIDKYVASQERGIAEKCEAWRGILKQNSTYEWRKENGLVEDEDFGHYLDKERDVCVADLTDIVASEGKSICTVKEPVAPTCEEKAYGECKAGIIEKAFQGAEIACRDLIKESPEKYKACVSETAAQYEEELFAIVDCASDAKIRCAGPKKVRSVEIDALTPTK